jgi:hypothetical protein
MSDSLSNRSSQFIYSSSNLDTGEVSESLGSDEFVYPGAIEGAPSTAETDATLTNPSPAQLEALYSAASSGDLSMLKKLFQYSVQSGDVEAFALANDASTRTGLTALHVAASRGYTDIVRWCERFCIPKLYIIIDIHLIVVEECGAMPDLEDKEGEVSYDALRVSLVVVDYLYIDSFAQGRSEWTSSCHNVFAPK